MITAIYVDDQKDDDQITRIAELLTTDDITCKLTKPLGDIGEIGNLDADIFLIDYDLGTAEHCGKNISYRGNSLGTEIRNIKPVIPIVLVSRRNVLGTLDLQLTTGRSDFDLILYKNDILDDPKRALQQLLALHDGYMRLTRIKGQSWSKVLGEIGADEDEGRRIREAFPPLDKIHTDEEHTDEKHRWYVPSTIEWIRTVLMEYPGILYDSLHASARLGITEASFLTEAVQKLFAYAVYTGPLAEFGKRWWVDRLVRIATQTIIDANVEGPISEGFVEAYELVRHQKLERARCVEDREPVADQICYILRQPVKRENSIIYYPDSRPPIMDAARVSITGIKKDEFDEALVEASSVDVVRDVWDNGQT